MSKKKDYLDKDLGELKSMLRQSIQNFSRKYRISTVAATVVHQGESIVAHTQAQFDATPVSTDQEIEFQLGCISKLAIAYVTCRLAVDGLFSLNAPIGEYLAEFVDSPKGDNLTISHLLSHTGGYRTTLPPKKLVRGESSWEEIAEAVVRAEEIFRPGAIFSYEHTGFVLVAEILSRVTGCHFDSLIQQLVVDPFLKSNEFPNSCASTYGWQGIGSTSLPKHSRNQQNLKIPYIWEPAASRRTMSPRHLALFASALALDKKIGRLVREPRIYLPNCRFSHRRRFLPIGYGLGCFTYPGNLVGHNATGPDQAMSVRMDVENNFTVAIGIEPRRKDFCEAFIHDLTRSLGTSVQQFPKTGPLPHPANFDDFAGKYVGTTVLPVQVDSLEDGLAVTIFPRRSPDAGLKSRLTIRSDGSIEPDAAALGLNIALFREPSTGTPCLMLGMASYRRR